MKKTAILLILMMICSVFVFAEDGASSKNHQIFAGFQYRYEDFDTNLFKDYVVNIDGETLKADIKDVYDKTGAISLGWATRNGGRVGFYNSMALTIPYYTTISSTVANPTATLDDIKENLGDCEFYGFGIDWLPGVSIYLLDTALLKIPVVVGGHLYTDTDWVSADNLALKALLGVGAMVGVEVHLWGLNIFAQCQMAYDFYGCVYTPGGKFNHGYTGSIFSLMPQIGVGLKF